MQMVDAIPLNDFGRAGVVYREIKRRITELHHKPGDKLSEARISSELGVGRSPVRTAFARLQNEGWIEISPWSGTFVRGLSDNEITEILETRLVLESYLAGLAAQRIDEVELKRLREAFTKFGSRVSKERMDDYFELDLQFHMAIYEAAGNKLIRGILVNLVDKIRWIRRGSADSPRRTQSAFMEICKVLEALEARDPARAAAAMRKHIAGTLEFRLKTAIGEANIPVAKRRRGKR
jgi:DNA-binding GntR family transcriptional regulator